MKRFFLLGIFILTFVIGAWLTTQVNRAAHYFIPDFDPQPRPTVVTIHGPPLVLE